MKRLQLVLLGVLLSIGASAQVKDPVVLTIEGEEVRASEFIYIYSKNNPNPSFHKDSLDAYMELFINYKLKVRAARDAHYDTIPRLISELSDYRKQLSLPYLTDKNKNENLIKEAYDRTKTEIRASHILVRLNPDPIPQDTLVAYGRILRMRERIIAGESFESVARGAGGSEDPSVEANGGDLGYFSAFQMVYPFEDAAFRLNIGDVSMPIRTKFGYHLIYCADKREAKGMIETAHILILAGEAESPEVIAQKEKKINEIYDLLNAGQSFEEVAAKYSEDQSSKNKGGLLPLFGAGAKQRMVPAFEAAAFALQNDGDYSKPVRTMFGFHIIKRVQIIPIPSYDNMYRELKLKVERDMRAETTRDSFVESLKKEYNYTDNAKKLLPIFYNTIGDEIFMAKWKGLTNHANDADILFSFKDNMVTIGDFEKYILANQKKRAQIDKQELMLSMMNDFAKERLLAYEDSKLESKYPEFQSLIKEYGDGILVFEIMQDAIWKKASKDTAGIRAYYDTHKEDFFFPVRYEGDLYTCIDKEMAASVVALIKTNKMTPEEIVKSVNVSSELNAKVKTQIFSSETTDAFKVRKSFPKLEEPTDKSDTKAMEAYKKALQKQNEKKAKYKLKTFEKGLNKPYKNGDLYYVFNVKEVLEPRQREYSEAKGLVTAAYQNQLEKEWLLELRKKYNVVINTENLHSIAK
jgi:peptidyl-prolyl cis-trans isomerase SurA